MQNTGVNQFLEKNFANNFIPQITLKTRIKENSATLINITYVQTAINIILLV